MSPTTDFDQDATSKFSVLNGVKGFPYEAFMIQQELYAYRERWYKGKPLNEKFVDQKSQKSIEKYPIKVNPLPGTARKHAALLLGQGRGSEYIDNIPLQFNLTFKDEEKEVEKPLAKVAEEMLTDILEDSFASALFSKSAILSQYLGGAVILGSYDAEEKVITISSPTAKEFFGIPDGPNDWALSECWIVREITASDAQERGYKKPKLKLAPNVYFYIEHWTKKKYQISINGQVLQKAGVPLSGVNPYKMVPAVYIPHLREDTFIGVSLVTQAIEGIIKEMNLRWADQGDAASIDAHNLIVAKNLRGSPKAESVAGREYVDLGSGQSISGANTDPSMEALSTTSMSDPALKLSAELKTLYRREVNHPAVADGEDEGSQRSSLTLTTRMWPMIQEVEVERKLWSTGLGVVAKILLRMAKEKNLHEITDKHLKPKVTIRWAPMMLRDSAEVTNEIATRSASEITSKKVLAEKYMDVDDVDADQEQISRERIQKAKDDAAGQPTVIQPVKESSPAKKTKNKKE